MNTRVGGPSVLRWLTTGAASYLGWLVCNLFLLGLFPILLVIELVGRGPGQRALRAFGRWFLRLFFLRYLPLVGVYRLAEHPAPEVLCALGPTVITANHRSWLDALLVLALVPGARVPVSASYTRVPLLGRAMGWLGCVPLERGNPVALLTGLEQLGAFVAGGGTVVAFPEGTRAAQGELGAFSDVFFRVAVRQGVKLVPLVLHCDEPYLTPGGSHLLTRRRACWTIRLLEAVTPGKRDRAVDLARLVHRRIKVELAQLDSAPRQGVTT